MWVLGWVLWVGLGVVGWVLVGLVWAGLLMRWMLVVVWVALPLMIVLVAVVLAGGTVAGVAVGAVVAAVAVAGAAAGACGRSIWCYMKTRSRTVFRPSFRAFSIAC